MRIPLFSLHRALSELAPYSEEERVEIIRRASRRHGPPAWLRVLVGLALIAVSGHFASVLALREQDEATDLIVPYGVSALVVLLLGLGARDLCLALAVRAELRDAHCHRCGTGLVGLSPDGPRVTCPNCHAPSHLSRPPLPEGFILARRFVHPGCPVCHQPLGPFLPTSGSATCPRCGAQSHISPMGSATPISAA